jgi:hypothetical protein
VWILANADKEGLAGMEIVVCARENVIHQSGADGTENTKGGENGNYLGSITAYV